MLAISNIIDDDMITINAKKIIKYINKHRDVIDKIFTDICVDITHMFKDVTVTDKYIECSFSAQTGTDVNKHIVTDIIDHHISINIPDKLQHACMIFLFRIIVVDENTIRIVKKK